MAGYGFFSPSIIGMQSQTHALNVIGTNIANVNTGGYKRVDTHFSTVLSDTLFEQSDLGGARNKDFFRISTQGSMISSDLNTDLAIGGEGFFVMNTQQDGSGDTAYTRDGSFRLAKGDQETVTYPDGTTLTVDSGYLIDKNGYYLQGVAANTDGTFTIPGTTTSLRVDPYAFVDQGQATSTAELVLNLDAAETVNGVYRYVIDVYDSAGQRQNVHLDFTKTGTNQWSASSINSQTPVAQVDTLTLGGSVEAGDVYTVTVNGTDVNYTVTGAEANLDAIRDGLVAAINANATVGNTVTVAAGGSGQITLTSDNAGTAFTAATSVTQGPASVAQADTVTIAGTVAAGDIYSVTVNGNVVNYTVTGAEANIDAIRDGLVAAINATPAVGAIVTAAAGSGGQLTLTADTTGTAFTAAATATQVAGPSDNTASLVNTTANYTALADNTISSATTTASVSDEITTALGAIQFNGDASINTPQSLNLAMTFAGGTTATVDLDISNMTQSAGQYSVRSYERNGQVAANMVDFRFDAQGHVSATFEDNSIREIYKVPLAVFPNPDGLDVENGMIFYESTASGGVTITEAGSLGHAVFLPNSLELSNVVIEDQFSKIIMTQTAYNASATSFKTADEMTMEAKDMKR